MAAHLLRTLGLVAGLAVIALVVVLLLPGPAGLVVLLVGVPVVALVTGRRHAVWAPVADRVARLPWTDAAGVAHETVVERARVDAAALGGLTAIRARVLRLSVYREGRKRHLRRVAVGDGVQWLGQHGERLWFLVHDAYYAGRSGLIGYDPQSLEITFHQPGEPPEDAGDATGAGSGRRGGRGRGNGRRGRRTSVRLCTPEGEIAVDLARGEVIPSDLS